MITHLVRHGEVENPLGLVYGSLPGFGLSTRGRRQAEAASQRLSHRPIGAVWSSPLQRALETAAIIASPHHLPVKVDSRLIEWRLDSWAGLAWRSLPTERPGELESYLDDPTDLPFVTESLRDLAARMTVAVTEAAGSVNEENELVVVGHQDPIQAVRLALTGRPLTEQHHERPEHASVITLEAATPWQELGSWHPDQ